MSTSAEGSEAVAETIRTYLGGLPGRGFAEGTLKARKHHLDLFLAWTQSECVLATLSELTFARAERYVAWLFSLRQSNEAPYAIATQANRISAVRMLLIWAVRTGRVSGDPFVGLKLPRVPRRLPSSVLSMKEAEVVLGVVRLDTECGLRDRAIMEVFFSTGVRRTELTDLNVGDVDVERETLWIRSGKGGKGRVIPIGRRALHWIARYVQSVRSKHAAPGAVPLFLSRRGRRLTPKLLTVTMRAYIVAAGVQKPGSCHIWRHTMATLIHEGGADIRDVQEILGHADLSTTQIYTRVSVRRLSRVHSATHPAERGWRSDGDDQISLVGIRTWDD